MDEEEKQKVKELEEVSLILQNIKDGALVERFKFTPKEMSALIYVIKFIELNLEELK